MKPAAQRIDSVDAFRSIAILGVVLIHTHPFLGMHGYSGLAILLEQINRFAVPFFFIASGYFFACQLNSGTNPCQLRNRYLKRLLYLWAAWSLLYLLLPTGPTDLVAHGWLRVTYWKLHQLLTHPWQLLFQGGKVHLWFLISLAMSLWMLAYALVHRLPVLPLAALFYLIGLLGGAHAQTPWGIGLPFAPRFGPFFGALYVAIGWKLAALQSHPSLGRVAWVLLVAGVVLSYVEWQLIAHFSVALPRVEFMLGTVPLAIGIMLLLLAHPNLGGKTRLPLIGTYTLGIYCTHYLFIELLEPVGAYLPPLAWQAVYPMTTFAAALTLTWLLAQHRMFRKLVV